MKTAKVLVRPSLEVVKVPVIESKEKEVPDFILNKWQDILNLITELMNIPVSLIMRLEEDMIKVLVTSETNNNPYSVGDSETYGYGLYCETVVGKKAKLIVEDALNDDQWSDNPDVKLNMVSYMGFPISWPTGEVFGTICVLDNKSNAYNSKFERLIELYRQLIEKDLQIMLEEEILHIEILKAVQAKSSFIANMNHELRNPLNGILGVLQLLKNTKLDSDQQLFVKSIEGSGKILLNLIASILDVSKIESGKRKLDMEVFDLKGFIDELVLANQKLAKDKGLLISCSVNENENKLLIKTDATALRQILFNIIGNAIKFTEEGNVIIDAKIHVTTKVTGTLLIEVADTGIGIADEEIDRIFTQFTQIENVYTKQNGGLGIGLYLVQLLVDMLGGCIVVDSELGKGTSVKIEIPIELIENSFEEKTNEMNGYKKRVLYIEDDPTNQIFVEYALKQEGIHVDIIDNGMEAVEKILENQYVCVLLDINLPGKSGVDIIQEVRAKEKLSKEKKRVIAVTAFSQKHELDKVMENRFDDIIVKPFTIEELITKVNSFVLKM